MTASPTSGSGRPSGRPLPSRQTPSEPLPPARFAFGGQTWREIAHLLANLPCALLGFVYVTTVLFTSAFLTLTVIGFPLLAAALMGARQLGRLER
ncbi:sensor domain-containing protein, partial [Streptomyces scabiei]